MAAKKLTPAMQKVIELMGNGWALKNSLSDWTGLGCWMEQGNWEDTQPFIGDPSIKKVNQKTLRSLQDRGLVKCVSQKFPTEIYKLTAKAKKEKS